MIVVGLSHRDAPIDVRERMAVESDAVQKVLTDLAARPAISEVIYLSTCNRVEVYAAASSSEADAAAEVAAVLEAVASKGDAPPIAPHLKTVVGTDAVRHLFRVACSLDSLVVGEPQILGQVKDTFEMARQAGPVGRYLDRAISRALHVAKRVRSETAIGAGQVSVVSSVAVDLARQILGDLGAATVLLIGAGEMAEAAAKLLVKEGATLVVVNRSVDRARELATEHGGEALPWDALGRALVKADVVIASTAARDFVLTRSMTAQAMKARHGRSLFFIDIAVPRDVEPSVNDLDNVYLYDIDNLSQLVAESMRGRLFEAERAEGLVQRELEGFAAWADTLDLTDTIVALRTKTRAVVLGEVERSLAGRLKDLPAADKEALNAMVDAVVNKLLHEPVTRIKAAAASGAHGDDLVHAVTELFESFGACARSEEGWKMIERTIVLATRRSKLALAQSRRFARELEARWPGLRVEELEVVTTGDTVQDRPLMEIGGKGLFVKEIEEAILAGTAHLAVHSFKDVPAIVPDPFAIGCVPPRVDARDVIVMRAGMTLAALPAGARVGTSSLRRSVQLPAIRPGVTIVPMRGNVDTRLRKLDAGEVDAILLARAGMIRLGLEARQCELLDPARFVPAPGQGALAIECRADDADTRALLAPMHDPETGVAVACERGVMAEVGADCTVPFGAHARLVGGELRLAAILAGPDGSRLTRIEKTYRRPSSEDEAAALGRRAGADLISSG